MVIFDVSVKCISIYKVPSISRRQQSQVVQFVFSFNHSAKPTKRFNYFFILSQTNKMYLPSSCVRKIIIKIRVFVTNQVQQHQHIKFLQVRHCLSSGFGYGRLLVILGGQMSGAVDRVFGSPTYKSLFTVEKYKFQT